MKAFFIKIDINYVIINKMLSSIFAIYAFDELKDVLKKTSKDLRKDEDLLCIPFYMTIFL